MNTAITRAKSLVAVVGDPFSLCTVGECRGNWKDYIKRCNKHQALYGASYEEILKAISASLGKMSLNPQAASFVPSSVVEGGDQECKLVEECAIEHDKNSNDSSRFELEVPEDGGPENSIFPTEEAKSPVTENMPPDFGICAREEDSMEEESSDGEEDEKEIESQLLDDSPKTYPPFVQSSQEEADSVQDTSAFFDDLRRESFEDETVLPRYTDKIIQALVQKCRETKENDARLRLSENVSFPSLHAANLSMSKMKKSETEKHANTQARQEKSSFSDLPADDYEICYINGRKVARLVNLELHQTQSPRLRRLTASSRQHDLLEPELLEQVLREKPDQYLPCTLRLNPERFRTAYAVISDTKTPDIKIKGRIRGVFDMDHIVIEKTSSGEPSPRDVLPYHEQGKIVGEF